MSGPTIAYFSMEIALETHIPTYSGGWVCSPAILFAPPPISAYRWSA